MLRSSCVALAVVLVAACNSNRTDTARQPDRGYKSTDSTQAASTTNIQSSAPQQTAADTREQTVTLTGCLTGAEETTATTGSSARPPVATGRTADERQAMRGDSVSANRFMLTRAMPASNDTRGVGANGAGGSGGPIVNGVADYAIVGNAVELAAHLNQQVTVTGRISASPSTADAPRSDVNGGVSNTQRPAATGTAGSGIGAGNAATGVAPQTGPSNTDVPTTAPRTLTVDSIQTVQGNCRGQ